jgi:hypothetical protein
MAEDPYQPPRADRAEAYEGPAKRGRTLLWIILVGCLARESAVAIGMFVNDDLVGLPIVLAVRLALLSPLYFLFRGRRWAKFALFLLFGLQIYGVVRTIPQMTWSIGCAHLVGSGLFLLWASVVLMLSPALEAFISSRRQQLGT